MASEDPPGGLRIAQDGRERLIQLMGERGGQLPEGGDAIHVRDLGQMAPRRGLGTLPLGDVEVHDGRAPLRAG